MFRKVLKGKAGNFKKDQAKFVDQLYKNPDYKDEMFQYFYPGEKAILQCNLSTSRGLSNGQVCTMVGMKYNSSDKQALYESALNDKSSTDIFVEVDMPDFILFEVDASVVVQPLIVRPNTLIECIWKRLSVFGNSIFSNTLRGSPNTLKVFSNTLSSFQIH